MLAIKLKIVGRKNQRTFRVIVQEARAKLGGKYVEDLGWYNPHTNQFKVNKARVDYWIGSGAQPTDSVASLLKKVENSEMGSYKVREGRKKKKAKATEGSSPDADAFRGPKAEGTEGESPVEGDSASTENTVEETPASPDATEDAPAEEVKEDSKEDAPAQEKKEEVPTEKPEKAEEPAQTKVDEVSSPDISEEAPKEEKPVEEQKEDE